MHLIRETYKLDANVLNWAGAERDQPQANAKQPGGKMDPLKRFVAGRRWSGAGGVRRDRASGSVCFLEGDQGDEYRESGRQRLDEYCKLYSESGGLFINLHPQSAAWQAIPLLEYLDRPHGAQAHRSASKAGTNGADGGPALGFGPGHRLRAPRLFHHPKHVMGVIIAEVRHTTSDATHIENW